MPLAVGIGVGLQHVQVPVVDQSVDSNDSSYDSSSDGLFGPPVEFVTADGVFFVTADGVYFGVAE
jgi:hypothetical protein